MDDQDYIRCNNTYIPTSEQYWAALGSFSTSILIIGWLVTVGLFILFFEQVLYTNQTAHSTCKRHIYWIASVFPIMTLMSVVPLIEPRAHNVCLSVKMVYMSIGISHFTDLTMVLFGGEEMLLHMGQEDTLNLQVTPWCCCCRCLPYPPVTKYSLRLVVLLTDQLPFIQSIYYVLVLILLSADNITLGDVNPAGAFLWLNLVQFASVVLGVYGFTILSSFSRGYLDDFKYRKKSRSINLLVLVTNLQLLVFNIMGNYDVFPCIPPYISPAIYKQTLDNSLYLLEMMILGPYTYWQYHDLQFASPMPHLPHHNSSRSSSITDNSRSRNTSRASTNCTTITENSTGSSSNLGDASNSEKSGGSNRGDGNEMNTKENGDVNVNCGNGDVIITTQVNGILARGLNSNEGRNRSDHAVTITRNGQFASSDGVRDRKSILGSDFTSDKGNSSSKRVTSTRSNFFASVDGNNGSMTSKDANSNSRDSALASNKREKESKVCKRKPTSKEKTCTFINVGRSGDKTSASKRSKSSSSRSRSRDGSSRRASSSDKKQGESASRKNKTTKTISKEKNRKITTFYNQNEILETTTNNHKVVKGNYDTTTTSNTTDKSNGNYGSYLEGPTSKTINSIALCPGVLNRVMSLSQPNMKLRNEYERLS